MSMGDAILSSSDHDPSSIVAIYNSHAAAEAAVAKLQAAGIDTKPLSIIGKDYYTEPIVGDSTRRNGLTTAGVALSAMGIPRSSVIVYESALNASKFLLIVQWANGHAAQVNAILRATEPIELARVPPG